MKINPLIAKTPEDLQKIEFKKMKALIKKELKRLQKNTSKENPTQCIIIGEHDYPDKPGMALPLFGNWKGKFKEYAKKEVVKDPCGAIGSVYFDGVDENGQKKIQISLAKGKGKNKVTKIERTLKKLIPQATYNVMFNEISEDALDALEQKLDAAPEVEEVFEQADIQDTGEMDIQNDGLDLKNLLASNLTEISTTLADIKATVIPKIKAKTLTQADVDKVENLLDLCQEWQEMYDEASIFDWSKASFLLARGKVELIQQQLDGLMPSMKVNISESNTEINVTQNEPVTNNAPSGAYADNTEIGPKTAQKGNEMVSSGAYKRDHAGPGGYWVPKHKDIPAQYHGKKYNAGEKIPQEILDVVSVTWCNRFAMDLAENVMGKDNPFQKLITAKGKGMIGAGTMLKHMEEEDGKTFQEVTELAKAWLDHINKGRMVFFSTPDHIAVGVPTPEADMKEVTLKGKIYKFGKIVQAGAKVGTFYLNQVWGDVTKVKVFAGTGPVAENGTGENETPAPEVLKPEQIQFQLKGSVTNLSAKADLVLREILAAAGEPNAMIVNTVRTAEQQASVMLMNIKAYGAAFNRTQYKDKAAAGLVVDTYEKALDAGKSEQEILGAILAAVNQVGADKLSDHCNSSNPAIDIHPSSILNKSNFEKVIKADSRVTVICPPKDSTYHIIIK